MGLLSALEAVLEAEVQCLKGHQPALPLLPRALSSFVPSVLENTGFCLCAEWSFSFCSCIVPLSQTILHLTGRL